MCGRARCTLNRERIAEATGVPPEGWRESDSFQPTENLHPGMRAPVVYENDKGEREVRTMR
jgi:putative SOS response-associated peptidase YedK